MDIAVPLNTGAFLQAVHAFSKTLTEDDLPTFHRRLHLELLRRIVQKTRVVTGRTRGNWQSSIDKPAQGVLEATDVTGEAAIQLANQTLTTLKAFDVSYIANNVPWILKLESLDGMANLSLAEVTASFP